MAPQCIARVVHILLLGAGVAAGLYTPAYAAEPTDTPLAEVVVTGSRLRGEAPVGSAVTTVGTADIASSLDITTDRLLEQLPQVFDLGVSENSRAQPGGAGNIVYANSINLRGIGPNATLTLVDGHRATSNGRSIDPAVIPTLGLDRIEIVADGASGVYGSDAIAGVVNLIPRRNLNGGEAEAHYGRSSDGQYDEYQLGLAEGKVWETGQFMVAYEHVFRSNLDGDYRSFFSNANQTAQGGQDYRVTTCSPGTITAGGTTYAIPSSGVTPSSAAQIIAGTANKCNSITGQDLFPQQTYNTLNSTFTQEINSIFTVFADGFFSRRDYTRVPGDATATLTVPNTNAFYVAPPGFTGSSYTLGYNFMNDFPTNTQTGYTQSWEVTPGLRVKLPHDWQAEALLTYGRTHDEANTSLGVNNTALNAALASSNPATAFDPYGLYRTSAATEALISNQIFFAPTLGSFTGYEARFNGSVFELPGGEVKLATGYEGQKIVVDLGSARGNPTVPLTFRDFSRHVDSGYAEVRIPIFGPGNALPALQHLDLDAAYRYDRYDDVGSTHNPKIGLNWTPLSTLTLRASYGTSFRAPLIAEIYGNSNNLFQQNYQNPAGGAPIPGSALSGANLNLKPETATTWSTGADWEPIDNLRLSLTRWNVDYKNQVIGYLSDLTLLTRASQFAGTGLILTGTAARDRVLALIASGIAPVGPFPGGSANNVTLFVDGRNQNLGRSITSGFDFQINYKVQAGSFGNVLFNGSGTYIDSYQTAISASAPLLDKLNQIFNPLKFKARASVTWQMAPFSAEVIVNYLNAYTNTNVTPAQEVSSYAPVDLELTWQIGDPHPTSFFGGGYSIGVDVRNVGNIAPPYVNLAPNANGSGGYDATAANPIGRQFGVTLRKTW